MKILLKGGRLIDPSQELDTALDLLIKNGKVAKTGEDLPAGADVEVVGIEGLWLVPGLIDMHTHLREPGYEYKETVRSGAEAACAGGFTAVACMANTNPVNDNRAVTESIRRKAADAGFARVYPVAAVSRNLEGKTLAEFHDLKDAGSVAFSDDGRPVMNAGLMRMALEYAASLDMPVLSHSEDVHLSAGGVMHEGSVSTELGFPAAPSVAEEAMIARDILIAEYAGADVHICHVSTAGSVRLIREAKARGVRVTAETAPHYFTLTDEAVRSFDTNTKMNPPLRTAADVAAIQEGLRDGTIDAIACDHAPHGQTDKEVEYEYAASGISGLETSLALSLALVAQGILRPGALVRRMSTNPAAILKVPGGTLKAGAEADVTVIDPGRSWTVDVSRFRSRGKNSPFQGRTLTGKAVLTIVGGDIKHREI
ncbi:MAG: Dihydroorotase [Syntrophaceae bacterium PtaU1.Bin231]|nr:MAG: Dihydroorotase [Syntrophaceae bacterium PtaU1.Bin231]